MIVFIRSSTRFLFRWQAADALALAQEALTSETRLQQELEALRRSRVTSRQVEHLRANLRLEYLAQLDLTCEMEAEARTFRRRYLDCEEARKALEAECARLRAKEEDRRRVKRRQGGAEEATAV